VIIFKLSKSIFQMSHSVELSDIAELRHDDQKQDTGSVSTVDSLKEEMQSSALFSCYMNNKLLQKTVYWLQLVHDEVRIISKNNNKVKTSIGLDILHARSICKQPRDEESKD